jgi:hypothetical protein
MTVIAQFGFFSFDLGALIEAASIIGVSVLCLLLDLFALLATQAQNPKLKFATRAGAFSLVTGVFCTIWVACLFRQWFPVMLFSILAIVYGILTIAAGLYMRHRIARERTNKVR